jgi:hypothetical protein
MPPQPLSNVRSKPHSKVVVFTSPTAINVRPNLAPFIAEIIARWSDIEANICSILAYLLKIEAGPTLAMLQAVRSSSAQFDMIEAAAASKLHDPELEMFEAVIAIARKTATKRHHIAHHVWAHCDALPNALILVDPAAYLDIFVRLQKIDPRTDRIRPDDPVVQPNAKQCYVYRERDFTEIIEELKIVARCTTFLINYLHPQHSARARIYTWLCNEPSIQTVLKKIRASRPKPKAPSRRRK